MTVFNLLARRRSDGDSVQLPGDSVQSHWHGDVLKVTVFNLLARRLSDSDSVQSPGTETF